MIFEAIALSLTILGSVHRYCEMREYLYIHSKDYTP
jgi:hypothetical protein